MSQVHDLTTLNAQTGSPAEVSGSTSGGWATMVKVGVVTIAIGVGFVALYRPWDLRWGSTRDEVDRSMSGDDIVPAPTFNATRAVTVTRRVSGVGLRGRSRPPYGRARHGLGQRARIQWRMGWLDSRL